MRDNVYKPLIDLTLESQEEETPPVGYTEHAMQTFKAVLNYREPTVVMIDGANFYAACIANGRMLDLAFFRDWLVRHAQLNRIFYYTPVRPLGEYDPVQSLIAKLENTAGYQIVTKVSVPWTANDGSQRFKGNMDPEIITDLVLMPYAMPQVGHIVLVSGDGDFSYPIQKVRDLGRRITVIADHRAGDDRSASQKLIVAADNFVPLSALLDEPNMTREYVRRRSWQPSVSE